MKNVHHNFAKLLITLLWAGACNIVRASIQSSVTLKSSSDFALKVVIQDANTVWFRITGPDTAWFGVGFGSTTMSNTYAIVASVNETINELKLGNHASGSLLNTSISVVSDLTADNIRTVIFTRDLTVSSDYYDFSNVTESTSVNLIWAVGSSSSFAAHSSSNRGTTS